MRRKNRIWEIDFFRGLAIILVVIDHFFVFIYYIYGHIWPAEKFGWLLYLTRLERSDFIQNTLRPFIICIFLFIAGISARLSSNSFIRSIKIILLASVLTIVSYALGYPILFGILHLIGWSIFVISIIKYIAMNNKYIESILPIFLAIFLIIMEAIIKKFNLVSNSYEVALIFSHSLMHDGFNIALQWDSVPILIYMPVVLLGYASAFAYRNKKSLIPEANIKILRPICYLGRYTLYIYLLQGVVNIIIFELITLSLGIRSPFFNLI